MNFFSFFLASMFFVAPVQEKTSIMDLPIAPPAKTINKEVEITAESALIMERDSAMIIYAKNIYEPKAMASLTKLMTALLILEDSDLWAVATTPEYATTVEGARMKLLPGENIYVKSLFTALLVRSGNDAAITLANFHSDSEMKFVEAMNDRARSLGLQNTQFKNAHGLDEVGHYSTAFDLAILANYLLDYQLIRDTVQIRKTTVYDITGEHEHELTSTNELLWSPFPVYGLKTGTTDEAGQCLIVYSKIDGQEYIIVILGSEDRFLDAKALIWSIRES